MADESYVWGIFRTKETLEIALRFSLGPIALYGGAVLFYFACGRSGWQWRLFSAVGVVLIASGLGAFFLPIYWQDDCEEYNDCRPELESYVLEQEYVRPELENYVLSQSVLTTVPSSPRGARTQKN